MSVPVDRRGRVPATLLLAAHPDDEAIGAGGQLQWLAPTLHVAHLTPGIPVALDEEQRATYLSPRAYGACRARELDAALSLAHIAPDHRHRLSGADQRCARMLVHLTCEGCREFDFLRGVEPYKFVWGAINRDTWRLCWSRDANAE